MAPDIDAMEAKGGLNDKVVEILDAAEKAETPSEAGIPVVFALTK